MGQTVSFNVLLLLIPVNFDRLHFISHFSTIQIAGRHVLLPGRRLINSKFLDSWVFDLGLPSVLFDFSGDKVGLKEKSTLGYSDKPLDIII